jgi:electron transfer flavoprotein-quinone oxidoreductase
VPEGGLAAIPRLYADGLLVTGDAAGLGVNTGFVVRGMDLAIGSAIAAAETVLEAKAKGDFSAQTLSAYQKKLDQSYVMADMRTFARAPHFFEKKRLYTTYPELLACLMTRIYTENAAPQEHLMPLLMQSAKENHISLLDLARDVLEGVRAL